MDAALLIDAVRTPIGRYRGGLSGVRPDDLAAAAIAGLLDRHPDFDRASIEDVLFGNANGAGEDNRNVARMASLLAGLPTSVPGATVNRLCGSSMEAFVGASRAVETGDLSVAIAGGVESMTRAPWVMLKPDAAFPQASTELHSTTLGWRMVNPRMPEEWVVSTGEGAELLADKYSISRDEQDQFAVRSHHRAAAAWDRAAFADEVVPVPGADLPRDEGIRADTSVEALAKLRPAFRAGGTVTAGNSSTLNDGASATLIASESVTTRLGLRPLARIAGRGVSGVEPQYYGIGPVEAANKALARAGIGWGDLGVVELNEAFAAQSLACMREWPDLDPEIVNPNGGAIALGHPLGSSGTRILTALAWQLRNERHRWGLATMCIGVGQGIAVVIEAL